MKRLFVTLAGVLFAGCTHSLHIAHYSDFDPTYAAYQKGDWIEAQAEQFVVLGFVGQTDFVDQAYRQLASQCQGGVIQGIETQYYTDHGFFSWTNRVHMQGLCLKRG
jgi:hypothetical protein